MGRLVTKLVKTFEQESAIEDSSRRTLLMNTAKNIFLIAPIEGLSIFGDDTDKLGDTGVTLGELEEAAAGGDFAEQVERDDFITNKEGYKKEITSVFLHRAKEAVTREIQDLETSEGSVRGLHDFDEINVSLIKVKQMGALDSEQAQDLVLNAYRVMRHGALNIEESFEKSLKDLGANIDEAILRFDPLA